MRVPIVSQAVETTPRRNPLPSTEFRSGSWISCQARLRYRHATVVTICILAVAARLILVNQSYVDHWSWRQSDVAAIAANFLQDGFRFGFPQIDWAGNAPGYVGTEFPILPFIAALCYKVAGVHEWVGRIQAVIFFAVSLPFFFLLVRETFGRTAAVWATFFYGFAPVNVFAGRSFMPDVPSLSLAIVGLYFFLRWIQRGKSALLFVAAFAVCLSLLIKVTSIIIVAPLLYLIVGRLCQTPGVSQNGCAGTRAASTGSSFERVNGSERVKRPTIYGALFSPQSRCCRLPFGTGTRIKSHRNFIRITSSVQAGFESKISRGTGTSRERL